MTRSNSLSLARSSSRTTLFIASLHTRCLFLTPLISRTANARIDCLAKNFVSVVDGLIGRSPEIATDIRGIRRRPSPLGQ